MVGGQEVGDMQKYPWTRFWFRVDNPPTLSEDGFLADPEFESWAQLNRHYVSEVEFQESRCMVLLGEPGIGKSTVLTELESSIPVSQSKIAIPLLRHSTEGMLASSLWESESWRRWQEGTDVFHLFIDSLDEGQVQLKAVAELLVGALNKERERLSRLRLRITCRTAEWPQGQRALWDVVAGWVARAIASDSLSS